MIAPKIQQQQRQRRSRRRRTEIPPEYSAACDMIESEMSRIDTDYPDRGDEGVTTWWCTLYRYRGAKKVEVLNIITKVVWFRWKIQESFLRAAEDLIRVKLLSLDALYLPMNLSRPTSSVRAVMDVLEWFDIPKSCMDYEQKLPGTQFFSPCIWLSTLIVRSCSDLAKTINRLITSRVFGELDQERMSGVLEDYRITITINPNEGLISRDIPDAYFCIWLPHGALLKDFVPTWRSRYAKVTEVYELITGYKWEDHQYVEDCMARLLVMEDFERMEGPARDAPTHESIGTPLPENDDTSSPEGDVTL
jgi:hypothetical protein